MAQRYHKLVTVSNGALETTFKIHDNATAEAINKAISQRFGLARFSLVDDEGCYVCVDSTLETGKYTLEPVRTSKSGPTTAGADREDGQHSSA
eukprot:g34395.t1